MDNAVELLPDNQMVEKTRNQITITLSDKAFEEYQEVANWKNIPLATLLRQILEREHESPGFANLHRRTGKSTGGKLTD